MSGDRRLAGIMFTDLVGYSALAQEDEARALELLEEHRRLLRRVFPEHDGTEVKTMGDGFLVEFASSLQAVECAVAIQREIRARNATVAPKRRFRLRIGIHLGDVEHTEGDVFGDGVNIASRIEPLAPPEGVCLSEDVARQVRNRLAASLESLGEQELKHIRDPVEVYRVVMPWEEPDGDRPSAPADRSRIAVLPLVNISPNPEDEYFADGMTEELIYTLSKLRDLRVIAQTSVMKYKGARKGIAEVGRELDVGTILEGSARKADDRLRITLQLIDARTEEHLWSEVYDRRLEDVFAVQSEIAQRVADELELRFLSPEKDDLAKRSPESLEAYTLYLKGRQLWKRRTEQGLKQSLECFQKAIETAPNDALAYAGLADAYHMLWEYDHLPSQVAFPQAKSAAAKALELDDALAAAHVSMGYALFHYDWNWEAAEGELKRAIRLNPSHASAHHWHSHYAMAMGQIDASLEASRQALALDPLDPVTNVHLAWHCYFARDYDGAVEQCRQVIELNPEFHPAFFYLGLAHVEKSLHAEAIREFQKAVTLSDARPLMSASLAYGYARSGQDERARRAVHTLERSSKRHTIPHGIATIYVALGEVERAFTWLWRAYKERSYWMPYLQVDPRFEPLRGDPKFADLLEQMDLGE